MVQIDFWINFIANAMTIFASGLAIFIYFTNKEKIKQAFNFILNYSNQLTLTDLKFKVERLNEFSCNDPIAKLEIINILNEIEGQILGSLIVREKLGLQLQKIEAFTANPKQLTEPKKRSLVSELKETIRNLDVSNYKNIIQ